MPPYAPNTAKDHGGPDLLLADDFTNFSPQRWLIEAQDPATHVFVDAGQLLIDSPKGVTVWLRQPLVPGYCIEFTRKVIVAGGENDRLSDLNQFWGAYDPHQSNPFTRSGDLEEYNNMSLYYVGMGGNYNSSTRFRRYDGSGQRHLLAEHKASTWLLQANRDYRIRIELDNSSTRYLVDNELFFSATHLLPPPTGYFAFRQVWSRQAISNFCVRRLCSPLTLEATAVPEASLLSDPEKSDRS